MKIVVKSIKDTKFKYLVYLQTDDNISEKAEFANDDTLHNTIDNFYKENEISSIEYPKNEDIKTHPLILVFYLDRGLMSNSKIIEPFVESVNQTLNDKGGNMLAFFIPTDGEEKIECINPLLTTINEKNKINKLIEDVKNSFDIGKGLTDD